MLKKFLTIVFCFLNFFSSFSAFKVNIESGGFWFCLETSSDTAMLFSVSRNFNDKNIKIPEYVEDGCNIKYNIVVISGSAFDNILDKIVSVDLPKYLIKNDNNVSVINKLLLNNIEVTQGNAKISHVYDFKAYPTPGKLGWD